MRFKNLENLSQGDVIRLMITDSGLTQDEVAERVGWNPTSAARIFDPLADYWPSLPTIPKFCLVTGSTLLVDWILARVQAGGGVPQFPAVGSADLPTALAELAKELGDVSREALEAINPAGRNGEEITTREAKRIIRELEDLMNKGAALLCGLRAVHARGRVR